MYIGLIAILLVLAGFIIIPKFNRPEVTKPTTIAPTTSINTFKDTTDSDGDGIPDNKDSCKGTPAGQKVDSNGCHNTIVQQKKQPTVTSDETVLSKKTEKKHPEKQKDARKREEIIKRKKAGAGTSGDTVHAVPPEKPFEKIKKDLTPITDSTPNKNPYQ